MEFSGVTSRKRHYVVFNVTYQNLCDYARLAATHADSPTFEAHDAHWTLRLYFADKEPGARVPIPVVRAHLLCQSAIPRTAEWGLSLMSEAGGRSAGAVGERTLFSFEACNPQSQAVYLFKRSNCLASLRELQLRVDLCIFDEELHDSYAVGWHNTRISGPAAPALQLDKLFLSPDIADVRIECADQVLPAHSLLLSAASDVMAAMLADAEEIDFGECSDAKVIPLKEYSGKCVKEVLRFIYTGDMQVAEDELHLLHEVVRLNQILKIEGLKKMSAYCSQSLIRAGNFMTFLHIAEENDHRELRQLVFHYAAVHREELSAQEELLRTLCRNSPAGAVQLLHILIHGHPRPSP